MKLEDCAYLIKNDEFYAILLYNIEALSELKNMFFLLFGGALPGRRDVR